VGIPETVSKGMQQTNALFRSAVIQNRQIDALDKVYTSDARILPPGAPSIQGRAQNKDFWQQAISGMGIVDAELKTVNAEAVGNDVIEIGQATLTIEGGQMVAGKYVVHWKQEDGIWKWHTDIWNLNQ